MINEELLDDGFESYFYDHKNKRLKYFGLVALIYLGLGLIPMYLKNLFRKVLKKCLNM